MLMWVCSSYCCLGCSPLFTANIANAVSRSLVFWSGLWYPLQFLIFKRATGFRDLCPGEKSFHNLVYSHYVFISSNMFVVFFFLSFWFTFRFLWVSGLIEWLRRSFLFLLLPLFLLRSSQYIRISQAMQHIPKR